MFGRKTYNKQHKDSPETLMKERTRISCNVLSIKETRKGITVTASPTTGAFKDKQWSTTVRSLKKGVYVGADCDLYLDIIEADGDYYLDVGEPV